MGSTGWGGLFEVVDVSRSTNPPRIAIITSNGRFFDFPTDMAVTLPLPGDRILHAVCDVMEWRTIRALYIVEIEETAEGWEVCPKFPVWPDELPASQLETLAVVDYTGSGRALHIRGQSGAKPLGRATPPPAEQAPSNAAASKE
ncbi:MAG: hypothetical protein HY689_11045 [Chloroflexi bacterium]|nr:hypothetical protein [Chloroflexota bacterium]